MHLGSGAPKIHTEEQHNTTLNRELMVNNTKIIRKEDVTLTLAAQEGMLKMGGMKKLFYRNDRKLLVFLLTKTNLQEMFDLYSF